MNDLIIGKTYSMTDSRNDKKYIFKIFNKLIYFGKLYYNTQGRYGCSYMIDISLYKEINEIKFTSQENEIDIDIKGSIPNHYGGKDNPFEPRKIIKHYKLTPNLANVIKYVTRAGVKFPTLQGKIDDLQKAINYLRFEIEDLMEEIKNLEKEKNNG